MANWPTELPFPLVNSFNEALPNNVLRSNMDKGPDKVRRYTTANTYPISFTLKLTSEQWQILKTFYMTTLASGANSFDYTHPDDDSALTARFVEPPSRQDQEATLWVVSISLEILP